MNIKKIKGGKVIGMDPEIKKCIVVEMLEFLADRELSISEAKEVLRASEDFLDDGERFEREILNEKAERYSRKIIEYLVVIFFSVFTSFWISVFINLIAMR